jgi:uncharacterized lipoprotein YajG
MSVIRRVGLIVALMLLAGCKALAESPHCFPLVKRTPDDVRRDEVCVYGPQVRPDSIVTREGRP